MNVTGYYCHDIVACGMIMKWRGKGKQNLNVARSFVISFQILTQCLG